MRLRQKYLLFEQRKSNTALKWQEQKHPQLQFIVVLLKKMVSVPLSVGAHTFDGKRVCDQSAGARSNITCNSANVVGDTVKAAKFEDGYHFA
jgi:hypothetical protein